MIVPRVIKHLEQGGHSVKNICLPPMWPCLDSSQYNTCNWVWCWFSACSEGFSLSILVFPPPKKQSTFPNSNWTWIEDLHDNQLIKAAVTSPLNDVSSLIFYLKFWHFQHHTWQLHTSTRLNSSLVHKVSERPWEQAWLDLPWHKIIYIADLL